MRLKTIPLITYSIVLLGALFGLGCDCNVSKVLCPSLQEEHHEWINSFSQELTLIGDSGNVATVAFTGLDSILQEEASCNDRPYGGCDCDYCYSWIELKYSIQDTHDVVNSTLRVRRTTEFGQASSREVRPEDGRSYDELLISAGQVSVYESLPISNSNMEFLPNITVNGKEYNDVYIARNQNRDSANSMEMGYLMFSQNAGIIAYQGTQSAEVFTR